ncbi:hypothetical protein BK004_03290 [bacterium CG10_46_32]|nr:MAG: hypothetical protein BK004_03290 [bacterium CG10_46_32]PIR55950.1 MAG: endonuclease domain-containing protein [Parcubacteria group bacterium CG10_big_fil_rev_8_21_14_0_10_46_32]
MRINKVHTYKRRALRKNSTKSESLLWKIVRSGKLGYKFRRQYSIGAYIVDFYCHELRLVVELDGYTHNDTAIIKQDNERQKRLEKLGYTVKRYTDEQVLGSAEAIYADLKRICGELEPASPHPNPLPKGEGE